MQNCFIMIYVSKCRINNSKTLYHMNAPFWMNTLTFVWHLSSFIFLHAKVAFQAFILEPSIMSSSPMQMYGLEA